MVLLSCLILAKWLTLSSTPFRPDVERRVGALLARMTLSEKIGQLVQFSEGNATGPDNVRVDQGALIARGGMGSILNASGAKTINAVQRVAKAAVDAGAGTVMSSFNTVQGVPASASRYLMTDVLRKSWGFRGFVVSDWQAITELIDHGATTRKPGCLRPR